MNLLFIPKDKAEDLMNFEIDEIESTELEDIQKELRELDKSFQLKPANLGTGADWILIMAILNGLTTVFLLGDKINKGIEGWISIGSRIKNIFKKSDRVYVDKDLANIIGIEFLSQKFELKSIKVVREHSIHALDLSGTFKDRKTGDFLAHPYTVFITTFEINDRWTITLGIKSNGEIDELYSFDNYSPIPF
ncbi:hypothetical protein [Ekhidna sp.]|uniref:hypothetical protein n=1 Tax=Ekhidna sp. TaxID=2608089 RepID=UPI0032EDCEB4